MNWRAFWRGFWYGIGHPWVMPWSKRAKDWHRQADTSGESHG
jgi:hypothetical protein